MGLNEMEGTFWYGILKMPRIKGNRRRSLFQFHLTTFYHSIHSL